MKFGKKIRMGVIFLFLCWHTLIVSSGDRWIFKVPQVVLILSFDAARADEFPVACGGRSPNELYPNLQRFCQGAVVFRNAYSSGSTTWESIPSLYTGYYSSHHQVKLSPKLYMSPAFFTLAEFFRIHGYSTFVASGNRGLFDPATQFVQGFQTVVVNYSLPPGAETLYPRPVKLLKLSYVSHWNPNMLVSHAIHWMNRACPRCFFHVHFAQPHAPYGAPLHILKRLSPNPWTYGPWARELMEGPTGHFYLPYQRIYFLIRKSPLELQPFIRLMYRSGLVWADEAAGVLLQRMEARTWWKDALVIVTADHGEAFGERGLWDHGGPAIEPLVHVPLIIKFPGQPPGNRGDIVSLTDIFATMVNYFHDSSHYPIPENSRDLRRSHGDWAASYTGTTSMIRVGNYKLLYEYKTKTAFLYDLSKDAQEIMDILPYQYTVGERLFRLMMANAEYPLSSINTKMVLVNEPFWQEELKALGYVMGGKKVVSTKTEFFLAPTPLKASRVRFQVREWNTDEGEKELEVINTGQAAWPSRGNSKEQGQMVLECPASGGNNPSWRGGLAHDLLPGQSYRWTVKAGDFSWREPEHCTLVQVGYRRWTPVS